MSTHPPPQFGDWVRIVALVPNRANLPLVDCVGIVLNIEENRNLPQSRRRGVIYTVELLDGIGHGIPSIHVIHDAQDRVQEQLEVIAKPEQLKDEYLIHSPTHPLEERWADLGSPERVLEIVRRIIAHAARLQFYELAFMLSWPESSLSELDELPPEIGQLTDLKSLNLSHLRITSLPPEIGHLRSLVHLDASWSSLTELPPEIGQLSALETLNLAHTFLIELPTEIWNLTQLKTLNLGHTKLMSLPPGMDQLTQLETLDLEYTEIRQIPVEIWQLTRLKSLNISSRKLTSLPPEIGKLTQLHSLWLRQMPLTKLPREIVCLTNLKELFLSETRLTELPPEICQLIQLKTLDLGQTGITRFPVEFGNLIHLEALYLYSTPIVFPPSIPERKGAAWNAQYVIGFLQYYKGWQTSAHRLYTWFMKRVLRRTTS